MLKMIYGETFNADGDKIDDCIYSSYGEACEADSEARESGGKVSGGLKLNIALNRYRRNRCPHCGVNVGQDHLHGCRTDAVLEKIG